MLSSLREAAPLCQQAVGSSRFVSQISLVLRKHSLFLGGLCTNVRTEQNWLSLGNVPILEPWPLRLGVKRCWSISSNKFTLPWISSDEGELVLGHILLHDLTSMYACVGYDSTQILYTIRKAHPERHLIIPLVCIHPSINRQSVFSVGCLGLES